MAKAATTGVIYIDYSQMDDDFNGVRARCPHCDAWRGVQALFMEPCSVCDGGGVDLGFGENASMMVKNFTQGEP